MQPTFDSSGTFHLLFSRERRRRRIRAFFAAFDRQSAATGESPPARTDRSRLERDGVDVTAGILR